MSWVIQLVNLMAEMSANTPYDELSNLSYWKQLESQKD